MWANIFFKTKLIYLSLFLGYGLGSCKAKNSQDNPPSVDVNKSLLPLIIINTGDQTITNEPKIAATMILLQKDSLKQKYAIGIEYKGKTSLQFSDKKYYAFELKTSDGRDTAISLLGMPAHEDWLLTGNIVSNNGFFNGYNTTYLHNQVGYHLARLASRYAAQATYVEVQINDAYMGIYQLMEKPNRGKNRIAIAPQSKKDTSGTGGFIFTIDKAHITKNMSTGWKSWFNDSNGEEASYTSNNSFRSDYDINGSKITWPPFQHAFHEKKYLETYYMYHYPKSESINANQKKYLQKYVNAFESAVLKEDFSSQDRHYEQYIDAASFVDYILVNEWCKNIDAYRLSTFFYKDKDQKINAGPVWDMDIGFANGDRLPDDDWVINYNKHVSQDPWSIQFWWPKLMSDPLFYKKLQSRWQQLRAEVWSDERIIDYIDNQASKLVAGGAVKRDQTKWKVKSNYAQDIDLLKSFLKKRAAWMDKKLIDKK